MYFFADDTNILCSNADQHKVMNAVNNKLEILADWFRANQLSLYIRKTNYMLFGYKRSYPTDLSIKIDNKLITC